MSDFSISPIQSLFFITKPREGVVEKHTYEETGRSVVHNIEVQTYNERGQIETYRPAKIEEIA
jgi:hypothetical protein